MDFLIDDPNVYDDPEGILSEDEERNKYEDEDNEKPDECFEDGSSLSIIDDDDEVLFDNDVTATSVYDDEEYIDEQSGIENEISEANVADLGVSHEKNYSPSFTGLGKCKCGCASFVGHGSVCEACGHSYRAHGPY